MNLSIDYTGIYPPAVAKDYVLAESCIAWCHNNQVWINYAPILWFSLALILWGLRDKHKLINDFVPFVLIMGIVHTVLVVIFKSAT